MDSSDNFRFQQKGWFVFFVAGSSGWWFQPIWKILIKLGSSSPIFGVKIPKNFELPPPRCPITSCFLGGTYLGPWAKSYIRSTGPKTSWPSFLMWFRAIRPVAHVSKMDEPELSPSRRPCWNLQNSWIEFSSTKLATKMAISRSLLEGYCTSCFFLNPPSIRGDQTSLPSLFWVDVDTTYSWLTLNSLPPLFCQNPLLQRRPHFMGYGLAAPLLRHGREVAMLIQVPSTAKMTASVGPCFEGVGFSW